MPEGLPFDNAPQNSQTESQAEQAMRIAPQNIEAEQALLSSIMINNRAYEKVAEFLEPKHFAVQSHELIFAAIEKIKRKNPRQLADPITLGDYFKQTGELETIGGHEYLNKLADEAVTIINAEDYGRLILDRYLRRAMISFGHDVVNSAYQDNLEDDAKSQIEEAEQKLFTLATENEADSKGFSDFADALGRAIESINEAYENPNGISGVSSGFIDLDKVLGGLHETDLLILAGRPSMGKTALATNIAYNVADIFQHTNVNAEQEGKDKRSVAFFSLEMSADQLAGRILSAETEVNSHDMRTGNIQQPDFQRLAAAAEHLQNLPLFIDDTPGLTVSAIRTRARRLKREHGLGLIVIDYLQLIEASKSGRANDSRVQAVSEMTRGLKILAKELEVPVLALSQLSRNVESRENKRPQLSDLRESGSIEQDADVVMFVFREYYYLERDEPVERPHETPEKFNERVQKWEERREDRENIGEVIVAKQRHGPIDDVEMLFQGSFTKFSDLQREDRLPEQR